MADKKKVCIIGGGATGVSLLWILSQDRKAREEWDITLIHNQEQLGGHSLTYPVTKKLKKKVKGKTTTVEKTFDIDIGVQFISPMLYPNVHQMLQRPEFKSRVEVFDYNDLKIACAFPKEKGKSMNWGNFPEYQKGNKFQLVTDEMKDESAAFEKAVGRSLFGRMGQSLADFFKSPPSSFKQPERWVNYFLKPYLSIINGYGAALMPETVFGDLFPLFTKFPLPKAWKLPTPLGNFNKPGVGWQRFTKGARDWVQGMADVSERLNPDGIHINIGSCSQAVWTDMKSGRVTVQWKEKGKSGLREKTFDKVVLTTDMWTNSVLLQNKNNEKLWKELYEKYIGYGLKYDGPRPKSANVCKDPTGVKHATSIDDAVWPLMWGMCYIHSDATMLSPDLRDPKKNQKETLQFNAYFAKGKTDGNYDLSKTFTTYIQKNVLSDPDADGLYLTMYGYIPDPKVDKVPNSKKVFFQEPWTHGKWTPAFMSGPKGQLHKAQGLGSVSYEGQKDTNVYFAGNNTVADSEEGALVSAISMAEYAFNVKNPVRQSNPLACFIHHTYRNVMFPGYTAKKILKFLRGIFYAEVALDAYAAVLGSFWPAKYVAQYTSQIVTGMPLELIRWFGINLIPLLLVELVVLLKNNNKILTWILSVYLVGDIAQLIAYIYYIVNNPGAQITGGFIFSIATVTFLAIVRIIWLLAYRQANKQVRSA
ncbi:MAG: FAD/NAD(P)-binding protein [Anaerolineales bacterium]|nr:FAD/NAD(P)-binding protein [Anaerolineales bacterium]